VSAPRPSWLRRNAAALGALAVLLPTATFVIGAQEWVTAEGYLPFSAIEVPAGDTTDYAGTTYGPATVRHATPADELDVPAGAMGLVLEFDIAPGDEAQLCSVTLREAEGEQREWLATGNRAPCTSDATEPYEGSLAFVVPEDAGPFTADVEVSRLESAPTMFPPFIRFLLD